VAATYCSPESGHENCERLKGLARHEDDQQMRVFKSRAPPGASRPGPAPR